MQSQFVDNYADLKRALRQLQRKSEGAKFLFRGQLKFYDGKVKPSIGRSQDLYLEAEHSFWYSAASGMLFDMLSQYQQWLRERANPSGDEVPHQTKAGAPIPKGTTASHIETILQHYGARSNYVDVTKSLTVALWFAHHVHRYREQPLLPEDVFDPDGPLEFGPMSVYDTAWYEPAWPESKSGFLFVISPNPARATLGLVHGDFIDLEPNFLATRIGRQKAGLIYGDPGVEGGDLSRFVRAAFEFDLPLAGAPAFVTKTKTATLFPSPDKDNMYGKFLTRIPFRNSLAEPFAYRRALPIPEYYQSSDFLGSRQWSSFRQNDRYFRRTYFFQEAAPLEGRDQTCHFQGEEFRLGDATPILCPLSIQMLPLPNQTSEFDFDNRRTGLFFEYDPIQVGIIPQAEYSDQNARGIWIIRRKDRFWCRVFDRDPDRPPRIRATRGHEFSFDELRPFAFPGVEETERSFVGYYLGTALGLLVDVKTGKRQLLPTSEKPYLFLTETHVDYNF